MKTLEQLMAERAALNAEIEKLKNGGRWRAQIGDTYWMIEGAGLVRESIDDEDEYDQYRFSIGNYHKTESEALAWRERQIATQQIKDRIAELNAQHGWVADWSDTSQAKYTFYYVSDAREIRDAHSYVVMYAPEEFHGSRETIKAVRKEMQPKIKLWLGIKD